jgi:hypothetical protein
VDRPAQIYAASGGSAIVETSATVCNRDYVRGRTTFRYFSASETVSLLWMNSKLTGQKSGCSNTIGNLL